MPNVNVPRVAESTKEEMVFVTIPKKDVLDHEHPGVGLNHDKFEAGQTYLVSQKVADYITERLAVYEKSVTRLLRPMVPQSESGTDTAAKEQ